MWVLGDIFLSIAAAEFATCRKDGIDKHIVSRYDVKYIFTLVDEERNFILRIQNAFVGYANQTVKLPRMIVLILDTDFHSYM